MAEGCYEVAMTMEEVWQSEDGSSRTAEPLGSDEKKSYRIWVAFS